ncbi:MAG: lipoprotein-releasing ABC transporter permease subunit [Alphaproteobacteria bacterium]
MVAAVATTKPFAPFEWAMANRYLSGHKNGFVSVIAILAFIGITLGVMALIVVMSVLNGFHTTLTSKILGLNGHMIVRPLGRDFTDYLEVTQRVKQVPGVRLAIPMVEGQVLVSSPSAANGIYVRGMREDDLRSLKEVSSKIVYGSLDGFDERPGIVIGIRLANALNVTAGDTVSLISPRGVSTPFGMKPRIKPYRVKAVFEIGMVTYDTTIAFMPLTEAQKFFNVRNAAHVLEVMVDNPDNIDDFRGPLTQAAGNDMAMTDWRKRNSDFYDALAAESVMFFIIVSLAMLLASLNIVSSMVMLVKEKRRGIAILRTMGATRGTVMRVFFITGSSIGVIGSLAGLIWGLLICINFEAIKDGVAYISGLNPNNPMLTYLNQLPAKVDIGQITFIMILALALSFLATLFPSWSAARLDPVEALRYE